MQLMRQSRRGLMPRSVLGAMTAEGLTGASASNRVLLLMNDAMVGGVATGWVFERRGAFVGRWPARQPPYAPETTNPSSSCRQVRHVPRENEK